jgi:sulfate/thiosulfate transport system substrate-binding protein
MFKPELFWRRLGSALPWALLASLFLYATWPWLPVPGRAAPPRTVVFYGFSILGDVMNQGIFPAFQDEWRKETGERIDFVSSFAGSGTITNQLIMGVPAQMALLSLEPDARRLADAGVIAPQSWRRLPHEGVVNRTPFVILVRPGNPQNIRDFGDLARPGIRVIHPDPSTSGSATWAIIAEYGAGVRAAGNDPDAGYRLLLGLWRNIVAQAPSARAARTQFENGFGDALVTYEQEVLWDKARGRLHGEIVYPPRTILSEHTLVEIERNVAPADRALIGGFASFLWSDRAQRIFVRYGFRSVEESLNRSEFHTIQDPFLVSDFGGWERAKEDIVDGIWQRRVLRELGQ